jgi:aryl-alcohol dehydrogenase-like predicted oxidoreductase
MSTAFGEVKGDADFARKALENSIRRLGTNPDAWIVHRLTKGVAVKDIVLAMKEAQDAGKVKHIGLSEVTGPTLREAAKHARISFVEVEFSPQSLDILHNGLLEACNDLGVILLACKRFPLLVRR